MSNGNIRSTTKGLSIADANSKAIKTDSSANPQQKPAAKPQPKPAAKPQPKPAAKPQPKPAAEPQPKPAAKPQPKPVAEPQPKPAAKPQPKPATEPQPKPAAKPQPKPVAEPQPKPTAKPAQPPQQLALTRPSKLTRFELEMLHAHNAYREHHGAPALTHCPNLTQRAQGWADNLAVLNFMRHESQQFDGENLAMMYSSAGTNFPGTKFVHMWYEEAQHFNFTDLENQNGKHVTGHFTQVVWKNSRQVGFGRAVSKTGHVFVVARYRPPGNYSGYYRGNVLPPKDGKLRDRY